MCFFGKPKVLLTTPVVSLLLRVNTQSAQLLKSRKWFSMKSRHRRHLQNTVVKVLYIKKLKARFCVPPTESKQLNVLAIKKLSKDLPKSLTLLILHQCSMQRSKVAYFVYILTRCRTRCTSETLQLDLLEPQWSPFYCSALTFFGICTNFFPCASDKNRADTKNPNTLLNCFPTQILTTDFFSGFGFVFCCHKSIKSPNYIKSNPRMQV